MRKHIAKLATVCMVAVLAISGMALASGYPTPKPVTSGGSKAGKKQAAQATKSAGKQLENKTGATLAANGLTVKVHFPSAGKITITIKGGGKTIGSGQATDKHAGNKTVKVTFNTAGKKFLKTGAGKQVTVTSVFKPKKGKNSTSTATVTLG
jgi:hypothetical protein